AHASRGRSRNRRRELRQTASAPSLRKSAPRLPDASWADHAHTAQRPSHARNSSPISSLRLILRLTPKEPRTQDAVPSPPRHPIPHPFDAARTEVDRAGIATRLPPLLFGPLDQRNSQTRPALNTTAHRTQVRRHVTNV